MFKGDFLCLGKILIKKKNELLLYYWDGYVMLL